MFRNDINRHISQIAFTRVASVNSPWLAGMNIGDTYGIPVSHGEGKFVVNEELAKELFENGQVAFQYAEPIDEDVTMRSPNNPNGSYYAIEGIISKNGQIHGKMGHSERYENNLIKNIAANLEPPLFDNEIYQRRVMEKTQMIHNGVSKKVYATDEPDKVIIQYTDAITAYYKIKKALIKDKGLYCNAISSMIFKLLADSGVPVHFIVRISATEQNC